MNNTNCPAGFVPCRILFTSGNLEGIEIPQNLPASAAVVGRKVKSCIGNTTYTVVVVYGLAA
jgi:hypothetical protein